MSNSTLLVLLVLTIRFSILLLISLASVKKASSTLILAFADVSINLIPYSTANCSPRSFVTYQEQQKSLTSIDNNSIVIKLT